MLNGRDSKIHVVDYPVGDYKLLYSTAEVFTWKKFHDKTVLVIYGGAVETHELAVITEAKPLIIEGTNVISQTGNGTTTLQWQASSQRNIVQVGDLYIYMLGESTPSPTNLAGVHQSLTDKREPKTATLPTTTGSPTSPATGRIPRTAARS